MSRRKYSFETGKKYEFGVWDYILFSLTLLISALIGLFYAIKDRKVKNTQTFFLAGGNMGVFPVALSLLVSFISAITILGTPAEMYNYTTVYAWIGLGYCITIAGAAHVYIPVFYNLKLTSVYEYLEMRFCRGMRTSVSVVYIFFMLMYMSIVLYGPSLALNAVTGFTLWGAVVSVGLVCTFYTALGGMKAVLWSDTFQSFMIIGGLLAVLIRGCIETDGLAEAWKIAEDNQRIRHMDTRVDPTVRHSFWALVLGGGFVWLAIYGINQAQVQRACACPTLKKAQIALWCNFPGLCVILYLCCLIGIVLYAFYSRCDPKTFGLITASDQLLPLFVMDVMGHLSGFPGIFLACIFSGSLSVLSRYGVFGSDVCSFSDGRNSTGGPEPVRRPQRPHPRSVYSGHHLPLGEPLGRLFGFLREPGADGLGCGRKIRNKVDSRGLPNPHRRLQLGPAGQELHRGEELDRGCRADWHRTFLPAVLPVV